MLDLSGVSLAFGQVVTGTTRTQSFTVTNKGDLDLDAALTLVDAAGAFTIDTETVALAGGEAAQVSIVFSPAATGSYAATIDITSNDPDKATASVALTGVGVAEISGPKQGLNANGDTVVGFLDDDDDVDIDDFFLFADAFDSVPGDDKFIPGADFDGDSDIDIDDFFIFADNFGQIAVSFL